MNYKLLSHIFNGTWAIEKKFAIGMTSFVDGLMQNKNVAMDEKAEYPYNVNVKGSSETNSGTVRVIPVKGVLMKDDQFCGADGTATLGNRVKQADADTDVDAILLDIDTPGGSVDGTEVFADIIKNTSKPVIGFVNGLMASAGMWIGSATNKLIASTEHDKIGSIGVMISFMDIQPYFEKQGVKFHEVYSELSKDKNSDFAEFRKGNYEEYIKNVLNPIAEKFQSVIKTNRPSVKETELTGKIYFAKDVKGSLIDEIGNMDYAISEALALANSNSNSKSNTMSKEDKNVDLTTEKGLTAFIKGMFGVQTAEEKAAEKLAEENAKAEADAIAKAKADAEKAEADKNKALEEKIAQLEKENATLKGKAGASSATVITETDGKEDVDSAKIDIPKGASVQEQYEVFKNALDSARK